MHTLLKNTVDVNEDGRDRMKAGFVFRAYQESNFQDVNFTCQLNIECECLKHS